MSFDFSDRDGKQAIKQIAKARKRRLKAFEDAYLLALQDFGVEAVQDTTHDLLHTYLQWLGVEHEEFCDHSEVVHAATTFIESNPSDEELVNVLDRIEECEECAEIVQDEIDRRDGLIRDDILRQFVKAAQATGAEITTDMSFAEITSAAGAESAAEEQG